MTSDDDFAGLINAKIEGLRKKLLDFTRRNPLVHTNFQARTINHIRAVDELPEILLYKLGQGEELLFDPLPPIDQPLPDENTPKFRQALDAAIETDEEYKVDLEKVSGTDVEQWEQREAALRALKDRLRLQVDLPPRQTKVRPDLAAHARAHGITPSYELPTPDEMHEDGRHEDDAIQTLFLPDQLERHLGKILERNRSYAEETGIAVLNAAFGYLDWKDPKSNDRYMSPLIMLPVELRREKTPAGVRYHVSGRGDEPQINLVLAEMLSSQFGVSLPDFEDRSIERYFETLTEAPRNELDWRVRRVVAFGIYPSANLAMYHDLDTEQTDFTDHDALKRLLVGSDTGGSLDDFAKDYEIDEPETEKKVSVLVDKADCSQFSALVDAASGKHLAIEGPPGTGKSQTIVNMIADAMVKGQTVLFVAEKAAALGVVENKLRAMGLGAFTLPLIAGRATKYTFLESVRERIEEEGIVPSGRRDTARKRFNEAREKLKRYISILQSPVGKTDKTVQEFLGAAIHRAGKLETQSNDLLDKIDALDPDPAFEELDALKEAANTIEQFRETATSSNFWASSELTTLSGLQWQQISRRASTAAEAFEKLAAMETAIGGEMQRDAALSRSEVEELKDLASKLESLLAEKPDATIDGAFLFTPQGTTALASYIECLERSDKARSSLEPVLASPLNNETLAALEQLLADMKAAEIKILDVDAAMADQSVRRDKLANAMAQAKSLAEFVKQQPAAQDWTVEILTKLGACIDAQSDESMALRSLLWSDEQAVLVAAELVEEMKKLARQRVTISELFHNPDAADEAEIRMLIDDIAGAGVLSFLSSKYRKAKRRFLASSKQKSFAPDSAVAALQKLLAYRKAAQKIDENVRYRTNLGSAFSGIATNIDAVEAACAFRREAVQKFAKVDQASFAELMRKAPTRLLRLLPPEIVSVETDLMGYIRSLLAERDKLTVRDETLARLDNASTHLVASKETSIDQLSEHVQELRGLLEDQATIADDNIITGALGSFLGTDVVSTAWATLLYQLCQRAGSRPAIGSVFASRLTAGNCAQLKSDCATWLSTKIEADEAMEALCGAAELDASPHLDERPDILAEMLHAASKDQDGLANATRFNHSRAKLTQYDLDFLIEADTTESDLSVLIEAALYRAFAVRLSENHTDLLTEHTGYSLEAARNKIRQIDEQLNQLDRTHVHSTLLAHNATIPPGNGLGPVSSFSGLALLQHYLEKKRVRPTIREFVSRAADALLQMKPCWMMSPLAVAQYVPMGSVQFDLCIIDEASQMPPEAAIGAMRRARQVVVVGDRNQLPPTSFFRKMMAVDEDDADNEDSVVADASILDMANVAFRPRRQLNWHYRSRHGDLIRFSNHFVYEDKLTVFPSASEGLSFRPVSLVKVDGLYHAGLNKIEAQAVADAAIAHMRDNPDQSIGIVATNLAHASHIQTLLDQARYDYPHVEDYVLDWDERDAGIERFFVKNLENVQGDERDVIMISTVYGPEDPGGRVAQRFGPINGESGKRRLNVLFSRAKEKMVTFTSMRPSDILAEESSNIGAFMLKRWLEYSAGGVLEGSTAHDRREPDSDFERHVIEVLQTMGLQAEPQVGVAGYFIDIGVRHPQWANGYLLGIECDGKNYHSSKSARDRDRLRQDVLESRGWILHRIWSTDWFNNPRRERELLAKAIGVALESRKAEAATSSRVEHSTDASAETQSGRKATDVGKPAADAQRPATRNTAQSANPRANGNRRTDASQLTLQIDNGPVDTTPAPAIRSASAKQRRIVKVGSKVRLRMTDKDEVMEFTISRTNDDFDKGIVNVGKPIAQAILDCEEGEEFEFRNKTSVRFGIVERITGP